MPSALLATRTVTNFTNGRISRILNRNKFVSFFIRDPYALNATRVGFSYEMLATRITREPF
uniref:Uncharacterized protein n=1 Tax=uncultured Methanosarcinales archaeon TaxID=183757 RepID=A0A7H1KNJ2_9EURY|nr:hypothetical protein ICMCNNFD_00024 [uncultured Methanosarcinales archaeon]